MKVFPITSLFFAREQNSKRHYLYLKAKKWSFSVDIATSVTNIYNFTIKLYKEDYL